MTEGMMGRTSDTRMYAPRSESSHMFRANHEDESTPTGLEDARDKEARMDRKQKKKELEEKEDKKIRHIKVRRHHMGLDKPEETEDEEFKPRESPEEPTSPPGAGGFLTSNDVLWSSNNWVAFSACVVAQKSLVSLESTCFTFVQFFLFFASFLLSLCLNPVDGDLLPSLLSTW